MRIDRRPASAAPSVSARLGHVWDAVAVPDESAAAATAAVRARNEAMERLLREGVDKGRHQGGRVKIVPLNS